MGGRGFEAPMGVGNGEGPQPTSGSGEASWAPPARSGADLRPKNGFQCFPSVAECLSL